jgi:hypothetical protein
MTEDIERLFRNINQAHIPYQVFEPPTVPSPAIGHAEPETIRLETATWTPEPPAAAPSGTNRGKVFGKYTAPANSQPAVEAHAGTALKPIFDRLREKCRVAQG